MTAVPMRHIVYPLLIFFLLTSAWSDEAILGVLEDVPGKGQGSVIARLLFVRERDGWIALEDRQVSARYDLAGRQWTMARNGRSLGAIRLTDVPLKGGDLYAWSYKRDKIYAVDSLDSIPRNKAGKSNQSTSFPPLILVSKPLAGDPEKWKPFRPGPQYRQRMLQPLRLVIGRFGAAQFQCMNKKGEPQPVRFKSGDIVLRTGYRSLAGTELISAALDLEKINCSSPTDPEMSSHWFLISGNDMDHLGREMEFLDSGDYDSDGKSEMLFWTSGYNRAGYILVYSNFRMKTEYVWCYH